MSKGCLAAIALAAAWLAAAPAQASPRFQCGSVAIEIGDTKSKLRRACGEPAEIRRSTSSLVERGGIYWPTVADEEWVYNLGPQRFIRILRFEGGRIVDIRTGGYGWVEEPKKEPPSQQDDQGGD